jgi:uncharacterized protein YndB with AHSA1/START domain
MSVVSNAVTIDRSPAEVFDFVTTPANWPRWHPSSVRVTGDAGHSLRAGERCVEEYVVAGRRGSGEWTVIACNPPLRWTIEANPPGGGHARIDYELAAADAGTVFTRTLRYEMPNAFLAILDRLSLRRRIARESATAVNNLRLLLE